jgi:hypothetical protein
MSYHKFHSSSDTVQGAPHRTFVSQERTASSVLWRDRYVFHSRRLYTSKPKFALDTCLRRDVEDKSHPLGRCPAHCARAYRVSCYREQLPPPSYCYVRLSELSMLLDTIPRLPPSIYQASLITQILIRTISKITNRNAKI